VPSYEIIVQHRSGEPASQRRVSLGGTGGLSRSAYTNRYGHAMLEHSAAEVAVFVDGRHRGSARPGRTVVTLG